MKQQKHVNIPIFIPHLGCPNNCVFCNQRKISGIGCFVRENVKTDIDAYLATIPPEKAKPELAYFGGSFTAIDREDMLYLLRLGHQYILDGKITSIRVSTRPDCINDEILELLAKYGVTTVELGIQSLSDRVLDASGRGHSAQCSLDACRLVKRYGFELVGQMMTALPRSTVEDEIATAKGICDVGADAARIYPTMVFAATELDAMRLRGEYTPPDEDDLIARTASAFSVFAKNNVKVIRIGLSEGETLHTDDGICAGSYHPAMGELVLSQYYLTAIKAEIERLKTTSEIHAIEIGCAPGEVSKTVGHGKRNKIALENVYNVKNIKVIENDDILLYNISVKLF